VEGDAVGEQRGCYCGEDCAERGFVHEESFDGVAGGWVAEFRIEQDLDAHVLVCVGVDVDVAEAVCVPEDGDAGVVFNVFDELV